MDFLKDLWAFMKVRKKFWLMPIILVLLTFGALIVFTSANAVDSVVACFIASGRKPGSLTGPLLVAIGPATADKIRGYGLTAGLVSAKNTSEGLLEGLAEIPVKDKKVLIPGAAEGRRIIADGLRARGAEVVEVEAYRSIMPSPAEPAIRQALDELVRGPVDMAVFASPSAVNNLGKMLDSNMRERMRAVPAAVIGPVTAQAAREAGYKVVAEPAGQTVDGVISSIKEALQNR